MSRVWPADYDADCYVLLPIAKAMVPIALGKLAELEQRSEWATESDWESGYQWIVCLQECAGLDCVGKIFKEQALLLAYMSGLPDRSSVADIKKILPLVGASIEEIDLSGDDPLKEIRGNIGRIATLTALLEMRGQNLDKDPTGMTYTTLTDLLEKQTKTAEGIGGLPELGALIAVALGYPPTAGAALGAALPIIGGLLDSINSGGLASALDDTHELQVPALVKALRGSTEEPDEDALLDQVKDFLKG
ncbi:MAG: hypothetical protein GF393_12755 [Armatimonadia bacterium]|nr:hypothetical protein [Armatimonadia bacterium]